MNCAWYCQTLSNTDICWGKVCIWKRKFNGIITRMQIVSSSVFKFYSMRMRIYFSSCSCFLVFTNWISVSVLETRCVANQPVLVWHVKGGVDPFSVWVCESLVDTFLSTYSMCLWSKGFRGSWFVSGNRIGTPWSHIESAGISGRLPVMNHSAKKEINSVIKIMIAYFKKD